MTSKETHYIHNQLCIIQGKADAESLKKYEVLLHSAKLEKHIKEPLQRACAMRHEEIGGRANAFVVASDTSDVVDYDE